MVAPQLLIGSSRVADRREPGVVVSYRQPNRGSCNPQSARRCSQHGHHVGAPSVGARGRSAVLLPMGCWVGA